MKSLTRQCLADTIAASMPAINANKAAATIVELIKEAIFLRKSVYLNGIGKIIVRKKAGRMGRNPKTSEDVFIPPRHSIIASGNKGLQEGKFTKADFVKSFNIRGYTLAQADTIYRCWIDFISNTVSKGTRIELRGLGVFYATEQPVRTKCNPKTREVVTVPAGRKFSFRCSDALRRSLDKEYLRDLSRK